ncbi:Gfo/Idh/MocA family protein [Nakamurella endophytica]|uniref:Oxidoreductase n=1 Tax=Nakamurella endophytica TaxID=1748367 RepID=A0A917STB9_9ACTN|nr:Gfo/Idh/MocA family oxidoreductase [Nakamurella endophytica]GGL97604.1 oxidoreductase [Nakamurella endophytica]
MNDLHAAVVAVGAQGSVHLHGYRRLAGVRVVGVTDSEPDRATAVASGIGATTYAGVAALLESETVDVLSVCTPPAHHERIVLDALDAGVPAVHCEKPMALTFGGARRMSAAADSRGALLTVNHQRRLDPAYRSAREAVRAGEIGDVQSFEGYCANLFDWGSHVVDLILFFAGDEGPAQVFGSIDVTERRHVYGALVETAAVSHLYWADGRHATIFTGHVEALSREPRNIVVVHGTDGRLEVRGSEVVVRRFDGGGRRIACTVDAEHRVDLHGVDPAVIQGTALALQDLVQCLRSGAEPVLAARHGLAAAEVVFATYQSSALRAPVTLPLTSTDNALLRGLELGYWTPIGESHGTS